MDRLAAAWEKFTNIFSQFIRFFQLLAWSFADRFAPEMREGYPYVLRSYLASVAGSSTNNFFNAADLTNNTTDEFVVAYMTFEADPQVGAFATGGTAGSYRATHDFDLRIKVKDVSSNADLMKVPTEVGLLIDPQTRRWTPERRVILQGGQNSQLQVSVDNTNVSAISYVYVSVHGFMRSRKNVPQ